MNDKEWIKEKIKGGCDMTREEAIKRFKRMKKILSIPNSDAERTKEAIDMAIKALQQTAWIPVGERLPDIDQIVLICTGDGQITDGYRWNSEDWFLAWGEFNGEHTGGEYIHIVAWMPLPEPYRGGEDNAD